MVVVNGDLVVLVVVVFENFKLLLGVIILLLGEICEVIEKMVGYVMCGGFGFE